MRKHNTENIYIVEVHELSSLLLHNLGTGQQSQSLCLRLFAEPAMLKPVADAVDEVGLLRPVIERNFWELSVRDTCLALTVVLRVVPQLLYLELGRQSILQPVLTTTPLPLTHFPSAP